MISVRVKSSSDFKRVMNIVHSRRARINMTDGTTEYTRQHTDEGTKTRIATLPVHPASHLIITVDVAATTNDNTNDNTNTIDRTLTAVSLGTGLHPSSFEMEQG